MRMTIVIALAAVVAMLLQTTIGAAVAPLTEVVPNLVLVLAVYLGLRHHGVGGVVGAFLLGYFLDTFSGTLLGGHAAACTAAYVGAYLIARTLWTEAGLGPRMRMESESNRTRLVRVRSARGVVYDRRGEILIDNRPSFDVVFVPEDAPDKKATLKGLATLLGETETQLHERLRAPSK